MSKKNENKAEATKIPAVAENVTDVNLSKKGETVADMNNKAVNTIESKPNSAPKDTAKTEKTEKEKAVKEKKAEKAEVKKAAKADRKSDLPISLWLRLKLWPIGYRRRKCLKKLGRLKRIIVKNRHRSSERIGYLIAKMEFIYYSYRIQNLKYNAKLISGQSVESGVLNVFRKYLYDIVLEDKVEEVNRVQAINVLIGQDSYKTLYELAKSRTADGRHIDKARKKPVTNYIIENFPENCDQWLLNLAFNWSTNSNTDLVRTAIEKIESPKELLTLCMFLRRNIQQFHHVKLAVERIGDMIIDNLYLLVYSEYHKKDKDFDEEISKKIKNEEKNKWLKSKVSNNELKKYLKEVLGKYNPDSEADWLEQHEKSMLLSAHRALEIIVLVFGEDSITSGDVVDSNKEMQLVLNAINSMVVVGFIDNLSNYVTNTSKKSYFTKRVNELKNGDIVVKDSEDELRKEIYCLLRADTTESDQIAALDKINMSEKDPNTGKYIGLRSKKYQFLTATLNDRLEKKMKGEHSYPPITDNVGYKFCKLYNGDHKYGPKPGHPEVQKCNVCGREANTNYTELVPAGYTTGPMGTPVVNGSPDNK